MANGNPVILGNADTSTKQTTITASTPTGDAGLRVQNYNGTGIAAGALKGTALTAGSGRWRRHRRRKLCRHGC